MASRRDKKVSQKRSTPKGLINIETRDGPEYLKFPKVGPITYSIEFDHRRFRDEAIEAIRLRAERILNETPIKPATRQKFQEEIELSPADFATRLLDNLNALGALHAEIDREVSEGKLRNFIDSAI